MVQSGGALGYKGPELLKVVRDGLVPVSDRLISGVAGDEKVFQIVTLPFLVRNFDELKFSSTFPGPISTRQPRNGTRRSSTSPPGPAQALDQEEGDEPRRHEGPQGENL